MSLDDILNRRTLRLKAELTEGDRPKAGFLSTIYPAMDHGANMPHVLKTPSSIPCSNDGEDEEIDTEGPEKGEKEVDEPGPSKTTSASLRVVPGESAMVPEAHKKAAFELGYFGEGRSDRFIKNCVSIITGVKRLEQDETEGGDVDVPGKTKHGKGRDSKGCGCGMTPCGCGSKESVSSGDGHDHTKLSDLAKRIKEPKTSHG